MLLLVDFQTRLLPAIDGGAAALGAAIRLTKAAQALGIPVRATEQAPARIGPTAPELAALLSSAEIFEKTHFSAMREPAFAAHLPENRPRVVMAGTEAHVCVLQTALDLKSAGYAPALCVDAVGSRFALDRETGLARMRSAGIEMITAEMAIFEWLERADSDEFRALLPLIRDR